MCRLLLGLFYWFAQYNVFIVNGIIIINQLLILPLRDFFLIRFRNTSKRHFPVQGAFRRRSLVIFRKRIKRTAVFRLLSGLFDVVAPAVGVLKFAELDACNPLVQLGADRSYDTVGNETI